MVVRLTTPETAGAKSGGAESVAFDDPVVANQLFGPRNAHLELLAAASGARITSRGASLIVDAPDPQVRETLCNVFVQLYDLLRGGVPLSQQDMARAYEMLRGDPGLNLGQIFRDAVFVNTPRKTVTARNVAQRTYLDLLRRYELVFAVGPAGTGQDLSGRSHGTFHVAAAQGQTHCAHPPGSGGRGNAWAFCPAIWRRKSTPICALCTMRCTT